MRRAFPFLLLASLCSLSSAWSQETPRAARSGLLPVAGGRIFYEEFGPGAASPNAAPAAAPLVLMHDGVAHREVWDAQIAPFSARYRVIRYDRRGFGRSDAPDAPYSDLADLGALLDSLLISRAVLIGSSAAGGLAIQYALAHPERAEALVLVGPVVDGLGYSAHFGKRGLLFYEQDPQKRAANIAADPYLIAPGNDAARRRLAELLAACPNDIDCSRAQFGQTSETAALSRLPEIHVPTLILTADHDIPDVHAHAGAIEAGIAGARRVVLANAGHLAYIEQPAAFNAAVLEFLSLASIPTFASLGAGAAAAAGPAGLWSGFRRGFAPVDGTVLYYETLGEGEPVVLVHGGYVDHRMWDEQFAALAQAGFRVIRYDQRGHGLSPSPFGAFRNYEDLRQLLERLGIARASLVGLCLGGATAIDFTLAHPEMVRSLVLVSSGLSGFEFKSQPYLDARRGLVEGYVKGDFEAAVESFQRGWTDGPQRRPSEVEPAVRERVRAMLVEGIQPGKNDWPTIRLDPPAVGRLAEIRAPTLAVLGGVDVSEILEIGARIGKEVRGARVVTFPRAAHMLNMEEPERFNATVLEFLGQ